MRNLKWTDQQKTLHAIKIAGGAALVLPIINLAIKIGPKNAKKILDLALEIGPEETILALTSLVKNTVKIAA